MMSNEDSATLLIHLATYANMHGKDCDRDMTVGQLVSDLVTSLPPVVDVEGVTIMPSYYGEMVACHFDGYMPD